VRGVVLLPTVQYGMIVLSYGEEEAHEQSLNSQLSISNNL
jgi:hypothetical protein